MPAENKKKRLAADAVCWILLAVFAFYVNRDIVIKGLYMDDLYMWSCYGEQSLLEFAFPIGTSTRFRPVYWLATYLQMAIVGNHISWFVPFNIICNLIAAYSLYYMAKKLGPAGFPGQILGFLSGICYLVSRFAYYQIGQALGLMETMALVMALWVLYLLYRYLNAPHERTRAELIAEGERARSRGKKTSLSIRMLPCGDWRFALALLLYFLLVFTHERYLALLPLFYLAFLFRCMRERRAYRTAFLREKYGFLIAPALVFILIFLIRRLCIGSAIPAGTGGTEVTDTFSLSEALSYAVSQVLYIFGVNAGPEHLCGLPWSETPENIKLLVKLSLLPLLVICAAYGVLLLIRLAGKDREKRRAGFWELQDIVLFLGFIALCIGCSSVTIRVEMRWIYVSYAAALLFCAYLIGRVTDAVKGKRMAAVLPALLFFLYTGLSVCTNVFYRQYYPKLYFWPNQLRMNSLAEETWEKYGDGIFGKDIYILENSYGMSDFYKDTFFKTFDKNKKAEGTRVFFIDSVSEIPEEDIRSGALIVLKEVPEENAYRDVTGEVLSGETE
ncbi:MAG: hypothetical protein Q4C63_09105 [Eubacteriales bacterium]|nr:hypothetical protein [Eubacteriales bacterium]